MTHLDTPTLEQLADGVLPSRAAAEARAHVDACALCRAELAGMTSLFESLAKLPRFAPSADFANAVMARVSLTPVEHPALAWLRGWLPRSRGGWAILTGAIVAPAVPVLLLLVWLLTEPLLTPAMFGQWALVRVQAVGLAMWNWVLEGTLSSGVLGVVEGAYSVVQIASPAAIGAVMATLAVAFPLSAWGLVHLTRTPVGRLNHAK